MKKISPKQYAITLYQGTISLERKEISQIIDNFIDVLVSNNDLRLILKIIDEFDKYSKEQVGEVDIDVVSATKLNEAQKEEIQKKLVSKKIKKVNINNIIDKDVLGGVIIKYKDLILDASILNQMNNLKKSLIE